MDSIKIIPESGYIDIRIKYSTFFKEENGIYSVVVPAFNICYNTTDKNMIDPTNNFMLDSFFSEFESNDTIDAASMKKFILTLHKFGFRADERHNLIVSNLAKGKRIEKTELRVVQKDMDGYEKETHSKEYKAAA
mgnify:CR=1 FL=1